MNPPELVLLVSAWLVISAGAGVFLHDSWTSHTWLDKGNDYVAKRLIRRAVMMGVFLLLYAVTIVTFRRDIAPSIWPVIATFIILAVGSLMINNAHRRIVRQLY